MSAHTRSPTHVHDLEAEVAKYQQRAFRLAVLYQKEFVRRKVLEIIEEFEGNAFLLEPIVTDMVVPIGGNDFALVAIQPRDRFLYPTLDALMEALTIDPRTRAAFKRTKSRLRRGVSETPPPSEPSASVH